MATVLEYALMAGASYISTRPEVNQFPVPSGWTETKHENPDGTGFEAVTFFSQCTNEIVISYAGTDFSWPLTDFWHANIPLAVGHLSDHDQLKNAADYYLQVKAANPDATITLTGHSLGGGLASLIAVMFNESATTFDQAPFAKSALTYTTTDPITGIVTTHSVAQDLLAYLRSETTTNGQPVYTDTQLQGLINFINASVTDSGIIPNAVNVYDINVHGEVLSEPPVSAFSRIGTQADLWQQNNMPISMVDLHSQALLTAMLQSGDLQTVAEPTGAPRAHTLGQATYVLTDLLKMIFDPNLYAFDEGKNNDKNPNFLDLIVNHQAGRDPRTNTTITPDAMVTRFTSDLWKLAQDGGLTMSDNVPTNAALNELSKALIAFAMQFYYEDTANATDKTKQLFTDLSASGEGSNGIRFDLHDVSKDIAAVMDSLDPNVKVDLAAMKDGKYILKGYEYFLNYLSSGDTVAFGGVTLPTGQLSLAERAMIKSMVSSMRDWYVQAGAGGMTATDPQNRGTFITHSLSLKEDKCLFEVLVGNGADSLTCCSKADIRVGNVANNSSYALQLEWRIAA